MAWSMTTHVRYSEVDNQGFVFHSRYLEWVDHAVTQWLRSIGLHYETLRHREWDFVLRHAEIDWLGSGRADEVLTVSVSPVAIGGTSFTVVGEVSRGTEVLYRQKIIYVSIAPAGGKVALPDFVREALETAFS